MIFNRLQLFSLMFIAVFFVGPVFSHGTQQEHQDKAHMKQYHKYGAHSDRLRYHREREALMDGNYQDQDTKRHYRDRSYRNRDHRRDSYPVYRQPARNGIRIYYGRDLD